MEKPKEAEEWRSWSTLEGLASPLSQVVCFLGESLGMQWARSQPCLG